MDTQVNTKGVTYTHMPVHRYDVEERGILYDEPQRDRDKNYRAEQHDIISEFERSEVPTTTPQHYLKMGKYNMAQEVPENYWAPQFQTFMRRQKLLRCMRYISETYCVIDVYSLGINGRVFSAGVPGRMLIVEAYSTYSNQKSVIMLTVPMLQEIFAGDEEMFKPGKKQAMIDKIIGYLYFQYTIEPAELEEDNNSVLSSMISVASSVPKHPDELLLEEEHASKERVVSNRERRLEARRARGEIIPEPNREVYRDPLWHEEDEEEEDEEEEDEEKEEEKEEKEEKEKVH